MERAWCPKSGEDDVTAFYRAILMAAEQRGAKLVLIDVGPNLV